MDPTTASCSFSAVPLRHWHWQLSTSKRTKKVDNPKVFWNRSPVIQHSRYSPSGKSSGHQCFLSFHVDSCPCQCVRGNVERLRRGCRVIVTGEGRQNGDSCHGWLIPSFTPWDHRSAYSFHLAPLCNSSHFEWVFLKVVLWLLNQNTIAYIPPSNQEGYLWENMARQMNVKVHHPLAKITICPCVRENGQL